MRVTASLIHISAENRDDALEISTRPIKDIYVPSSEYGTEEQSQSSRRNTNTNTLLPPIPSVLRELFNQERHGVLTSSNNNYYNKWEPQQHRNRRKSTKKSTMAFENWHQFEEMALASTFCGRGHQALDFYDMTIQLKKDRFGEDHRELVSTLWKKGKAMTKLNMIQDAFESFDRAVFLQRGLCVKKDPAKSPTSREDGLFLATIQLHLGKIQERQGNFINAIGNYHSALYLRKTHLHPTHRDVAYVHFRIGRLYHRDQKYSYAVSSYMESLRMYSSYKQDEEHYYGDDDDDDERDDEAMVQLITKLLSHRTLTFHFVHNYWRDETII